MILKIDEQVENAEEISAHLAHFQRDCDWLSERYAELEQAHPNRWISPWEGTLYVDDEFDGLLKQLRAAGIDPRHAVTWFIAVPPRQHRHYS